MKKTIRQVADDLGVKSSAVYSKIKYKKYFSKVLEPYISKKGNTIIDTATKNINVEAKLVFSADDIENW